MWCSGLYCAGVKGQGPDLRGHTTRIPQSLDIMTWPCDLQQRWLCCVVSRSCLLCGIICQHVKKAADKTWGESRGRGEGSDKSMEFLHVPLWYLSLTNPPLRPPPTLSPPLLVCQVMSSVFRTQICFHSSHWLSIISASRKFLSADIRLQSINYREGSGTAH